MGQVKLNVAVEVEEEEEESQRAAWTQDALHVTQDPAP